MKAKKQNYGNTTGTIGDMNFTMKDCPFHLPKENLKFFSMMQKASVASEVNTYANSYNKGSYVNPKIFASNKPVSFT